MAIDVKCRLSECRDSRSPSEQREVGDHGAFFSIVEMPQCPLT
jgi:hypothetical protein